MKEVALRLWESYREAFGQQFLPAGRVQWYCSARSLLPLEEYVFKTTSDLQQGCQSNTYRDISGN